MRNILIYKLFQPILILEQKIILMISPFKKTFQFMIHIMIKLPFLLIIIILFLIHKLELEIIQIPLFSPILVKKKLFQNNPNCAVTLVVLIVISFYFCFLTYFVLITFIFRFLIHYAGILSTLLSNIQLIHCPVGKLKFYIIIKSIKSYFNFNFNQC